MKKNNIIFWTICYVMGAALLFSLVQNESMRISYAEDIEKAQAQIYILQRLELSNSEIVDRIEDMNKILITLHPELQKECKKFCEE